LSGKAHVISGAGPKRKFLNAFAERLPKDRQDRVRRPSAAELRATAILVLDLDDPSLRAHFGRSGARSEACGGPSWAEEVYFALRARRKVPSPREVAAPLLQLQP
jgi:hypothetical protein